MVVIPHQGGLSGSHPQHPGLFLLYLLVPVVRVRMMSWCGVFPICTGNSDAGSLLSFGLPFLFVIWYCTNWHGNDDAS